MLLGVYPNSGPVEGNSEVFISGSYFANMSYSCIFGSQQVPAIFINSTFLSCFSPPSLLNFNNYINITVTSNGSIYSPSSLSFFYYKCSGSTCSECMQGYCTWCLNSNQCLNRNVNVSCANTVLDYDFCPSIKVSNGYIYWK